MEDTKNHLFSQTAICVSSQSSQVRINTFSQQINAITGHTPFYGYSLHKVGKAVIIKMTVEQSTDKPVQVY